MRDPDKMLKGEIRIYTKKWISTVYPGFDRISRPYIIVIYE